MCSNFDNNLFYIIVTIIISIIRVIFFQKWDGLFFFFFYDNKNKGIFKTKLPWSFSKGHLRFWKYCTLSKTYQNFERSRSSHLSCYRPSSVASSSLASKTFVLPFSRYLSLSLGLGDVRAFLRLFFSPSSLPHIEMLLGKRSSTPMKRTASSMEFPAGVLFDVEAPQPLVQDGSISGQLFDMRRGAAEVGQRSPSTYVGSMPSPRGRLGGTVDFSGLALPGTASFLRACGLCNRSLGPGRDAYIYRYFLSSHPHSRIPSF